MYIKWHLHTSEQIAIDKCISFLDGKCTLSRSYVIINIFTYSLNHEFYTPEA